MGGAERVDAAARGDPAGGAMKQVKAFVHPKAPAHFKAEIARLYGHARTFRPTDLAQIDVIICPNWEDRRRVEALRTTCADCGRALSRMPHIPVGPPTICGGCFTKRRQA